MLRRLLDPQPFPIRAPRLMPQGFYLFAYILGEGVRLNLLHAIGRGR